VIQGELSVRSKCSGNAVAAFQVVMTETILRASGSSRCSFGDGFSERDLLDRYILVAIVVCPKLIDIKHKNIALDLD
jgi:hypothetical protein